MESTTPAPTTPATPPVIVGNQKSRRPLLIVLFAAIGVILLGGVAWGLFLLFGQGPKPTVENHLKAYWLTIGMTTDLSSEDNTGLKTPHDLIASVYNNDVHYSYTRSFLDTLATKYHSGAGDMQHLSSAFNDSLNTIRADSKSYNALKAVQPTLNKNAASYIELEEDFYKHKDIWPKLGVYNNQFENPLAAIKLADKTPDFVINKAKVIITDLTNLQTTLTAYQPKTELFKNIKAKYLTLIDKQIVVATLISRSDGTRTSVTMYGDTVLRTSQIDAAPLDKELDDLLISSTTSKQVTTALDSIVDYIKGPLNVAKGDFNTKATAEFDKLKGELGESTYNLVRTIYTF